MKKLGYVAAVAAIALTSCQHEKDTSSGNASARNEVAFSLQGAETRGSESVAAMETGLSIQIGEAGGYRVFLEETITDLNRVASATRGTPVYTENVGYLYKGMLGVYTDAANGVEASYSLLEEAPGANGWLYQHRYTQDIWPDENTNIQFYLRMPSDMTSHGVSGLNNENGITTLTYISPVTAKEQEDIIFGGVSMNHKTYMGHFSSNGGAPVTMYHALTGVKFAIKNTTAELGRIQINKISFLGLKNKGTLTFTSPSTVTWSGLESQSTETTVGEGDEATTVLVPNAIYQTFEPGDLVTYDAEEHASNNFADSFFAAGTSQNLNKADASYTFWLIPQATVYDDPDDDPNAILRIEYTMSGKDEYMNIPLSALKAANWQAGQLRTYTFKLDEVNLKIEDSVSISGSADDGYSGSKKTGVTITNTGNTKAFIRAAIVGQWLNSDNNPVFGFTDEINQLWVVESWYEDQFVNKRRNHGKFKNLPGYDIPNPSNDWQLCDDGYYYYMKAVSPGAATGSSLFTEYQTLIAPATAIAGEVMDTQTMHFELEISTQAISAVRLDGTLYDWDEAWERAVGRKPVIKSNN